MKIQTLRVNVSGEMRVLKKSLISICTVRTFGQHFLARLYKAKECLCDTPGARPRARELARDQNVQFQRWLFSQ